MSPSKSHSRFAITWEAPEESWREFQNAVKEHASGSYFDREESVDNLLAGWVCFEVVDGLLTPYRVDELLLSRLWISRGTPSIPLDRISTSDKSICDLVLILSFVEQMSHVSLLLSQTPESVDVHGAYHNPESDHTIHTVRIGGEVVIGTTEDLQRGLAFVVSQAEFQSAIQAFLRDVAGRVRDRAPEFLNWDSGLWLVNILEDRPPLYSPSIFPRGYSARERAEYLLKWLAERRI